ncbi:hypothetical protein ES319_D03G023200v1 [Gossypium barbadense]|uniref:Uncharacterized protein n=2 Tax=Gossypium TaxID=3633 RepID=A0A5J5RZL1_GOSBA|nr:hypothetical protein ES319_D03G023200v1 [Gossypium barbadense]TYG75382.1 hypothetical protein ES288_D03G026500v1 [Gossypium darwinii]
MACQDLVVVVALVFMVVVGAFAVESSPLPVPSKASSPSKSPSPSSSVSSPKSPSIKSPSQYSNGSIFSPSKSHEEALKSSHPGAPKSSSSSSSPNPSQSDNPNANKGYSSEVESPEEVSTPPSPTANDEVSHSPTPSPESTGDVFDSETLAPAPSNAIEIKATTCIVGVVTIVGFFLF